MASIWNAPVLVVAVLALTPSINGLDTGTGPPTDLAQAVVTDNCVDGVGGAQTDPDLQLSLPSPSPMLNKGLYCPDHPAACNAACRMKGKTGGHCEHGMCVCDCCKKRSC